jgi:hypothetical protein
VAPNGRETKNHVPIERLAAGRIFHDTVQSAFLAGLVGATGFRERRWHLSAGRHGRVDLAVVTDDHEMMLTVIEIKGTDWDKIRPDRVTRNLRAHLRQLQAYLDTAIDELQAGRWAAVAGALLYPARPENADRLAAIEAIAADQSIMLSWYQDADWRQDRNTSNSA